VLRAAQPGQPAIVAAACAASVRALTAVLATLNEQITTLQGQAGAFFGPHPEVRLRKCTSSRVKYPATGGGSRVILS